MDRAALFRVLARRLNSWIAEPAGKLSEINPVRAASPAAAIRLSSGCAIQRERTQAETIAALMAGAANQTLPLAPAISPRPAAHAMPVNRHARTPNDLVLNVIGPQCNLVLHIGDAV
jgi:hypothetical protein